MFEEKKKRKHQILFSAIILILIFLLLGIWYAASKSRPDETIAGERQPGETIVAGRRETEPESEPQKESLLQQADKAEDGDPLSQNTALPDEGVGAAADFQIPSALPIPSGSSASSDSSKHPKNPNDRDLTRGIDVSKWQGQINWEETAASGVEFAIIRVGYRTEDTGEIRPDPYAAYNLQNAAKAGIYLGAYFFSTAATEEEAIEEASWTADFLAGYPITYPVAYNCEGFLSEDSRMYTVSAPQRTDIALAFLRTIEEAGYEAVFHASRHDLTDGISWETERIEEQYPIWVAQYPAVPYPDTPASSYPGAHTIWQYTSQGTVPGISSYVDLNVAYFRYEQTASPKKPGAAPDAGDVPIDSTFQETDEMVTPKDITNLRTEPSTLTKDSIATSIQNGDWVRRTGISTRGWSRIEYEGQILYAISSLLMTESEADRGAQNSVPESSGLYQTADDRVTAKTETNLRNAPSTAGTEIVASIQNGQWVSRTGIGSNGWSRLDYEGQTVYALTSFLTTDEHFDPDDVDSRNIIWTPSDDSVTAKEKTNLRDKPTTEDGSQVIATIYRGDVAVRTGIGSNGWSRVIYEGQTLYAITSLLTEADDE